MKTEDRLAVSEQGVEKLQRAPGAIMGRLQYCFLILMVSNRLMIYMVMRREIKFYSKYQCDLHAHYLMAHCWLD